MYAETGCHIITTPSGFCYHFLPQNERQWYTLLRYVLAYLLLIPQGLQMICLFILAKRLYLLILAGMRHIFGLSAKILFFDRLTSEDNGHLPALCCRTTGGPESRRLSDILQGPAKASSRGICWTSHKRRRGRRGIGCDRCASSTGTWPDREIVLPLNLPRRCWHTCLQTRWTCKHMSPCCLSYLALSLEIARPASMCTSLEAPKELAVQHG